MAPRSRQSVTLATGTGPVAVPASWRGRHLAVHRPNLPAQWGGRWVITHVASGLKAAELSTPYRVAVALARAWDPFFVSIHPDNAKEWTYAKAWIAQTYAPEIIRVPDAVNPVPESGPMLPSLPRTATASPRPRAIAADGDGGEQVPVEPSVFVVVGADGTRRVRCRATLPSGRKRPHNPETGRPILVDGDVCAFRPKGDPVGSAVLRLRWRGEWIDVPSIAQAMEWTLDGVCETPDGDTLEPDAQNSWLRLLGLV